MLISSTAIRPPTITIANGRCESEPMPCDVAAGTRPSEATSIVIRMGRKRSTAPWSRHPESSGRARAAD